MSARAQVDPSTVQLRNRLEGMPGRLLPLLPLAPLQPLLAFIALHMARSRPELFARLGAQHVDKLYLIDPIDLPFVLLLRPNAARPYLRAARRSDQIRHDAAIAGTFLHLLAMIDGSCDGDALFFSRALRVSGDTEAVVALRNALDDFEGSALDSVISAFGPFSTPLRAIVSMLRDMPTETANG
jgi:predicted lipid carrier protein YhbT